MSDARKGPEADRSEDMFIAGYLDDRYRRGDRPNTAAPRGKGLPDAKGRVMAVRTCLASARGKA